MIFDGKSIDEIFEMIDRLGEKEAKRVYQLMLEKLNKNPLGRIADALEKMIPSTFNDLLTNLEEIIPYLEKISQRGDSEAVHAGSREIGSESSIPSPPTHSPPPVYGPGEPKVNFKLSEARKENELYALLRDAKPLIDKYAPLDTTEKREWLKRFEGRIK